MRLSVIIVNFNVRYFLEQCLSSVRAAIRGPLAGEVEVIVVDNASTDGSLYFLRPLFPGFIFIESPENGGFARANNLGLRQARGKNILFLNPDTLIPEDALQLALAFLDNHPVAGAAGVRMIDGQGRFLPESKRGFPGPAASFYKMTGLASAFPRSRVFAAYYAGHVPGDRVQEVDILSGAALFLRKSVLDQVGGFDERFFMYAEDIDLSWRIRLGGFKNYYLPEITIIHFKGESTRRDVRYVRQFYKAMHQFRDKYGRNSGAAEWLLRTGIGFRETLALVAALFRKETKQQAAGSRRKTAVNAGPRTAGRGPTLVAAGNKEYVLLGEAADASAIHSAMAKLGMRESDQARPGSVLVFCHGITLPWKTIIGAVAGEDPGRLCYLHGYGTHSLISSPAGDRPGSVIFLNS